MITLYGYPLSCSLAVHIVLRATRTPFHLSWVSLPSGNLADGSDYRLINPRCQVPAIADDAFVLTETPAILQYIADRAPAADLSPGIGTVDRARLQQILNYLATEVHKQVLWQLSNIRKFPAPVESHRDVLMNMLRDRLKFLSAMLQGGEFILGSKFTLADAYMAVVLHWVERNGESLAEWPVLAAYRARLHEVPAVRDALAIEHEENKKL